MATSDDKTPRTGNDSVPPVTANVDSTPRGIAVGAAVLLGLAFGLGCWVWCDGEGLDKPMPRDVYSYNTAMNKTGDMGLPTPFALYGLNSDYTTAGGTDITAVHPVKAIRAIPVSTQAVPAAMASAPAGQVVYLFPYGMSNVPESRELDAIAALASSKGLKLDVRGYTDEHGRAANNRRLSARRARAVADYLEAHGVPASHITVTGMGPTHAYANDAQDRRAEVIVVK